jgi:hypothetical protein
MKKLMLLGAVLAMLMIAVAPAFAQFSQDSDQDADSGDVKQSFNVENSGDNSNQCAGIQGVGNTGNAQNSANLLQYGSEGDVDFEGSSSVDVSPSNSTECSQSVYQNAEANSR